MTADYGKCDTCGHNFAEPFIEGSMLCGDCTCCCQLCGQLCATGHQED